MNSRIEQMISTVEESPRRAWNKPSVNKAITALNSEEEG